jgi:hypothetical protein
MQILDLMYTDCNNRVETVPETRPGAFALRVHWSATLRRWQISAGRRTPKIEPTVSGHGSSLQ